MVLLPISLKQIKEETYVTHPFRYLKWVGFFAVRSPSQLWPGLNLQTLGVMARMTASIPPTVSIRCYVVLVTEKALLNELQKNKTIELKCKEHEQIHTYSNQTIQ
jgi:hypothetical protein